MNSRVINEHVKGAIPFHGCTDNTLRRPGLEKILYNDVYITAAASDITCHCLQATFVSARYDHPATSSRGPPSDGRPDASPCPRYQHHGAIQAHKGFRRRHGLRCDGGATDDEHGPRAGDDGLI